jgi:soluble lytic murein transglycosylase-like protein
VRSILRLLALCFTLGSAHAAAQESVNLPAPEAAAQRPTVNVSALEAAAQRGDVSALTTLATLYERGENVERDLTRSNALWCKAAARGNADALLRMGQIYGSGREVMRNEGVASLLIAKAAELGNERAKEILPLVSRGVGSVMPACMNEAVADTVDSKPAPVAVPSARSDIAKLVQRWAPQYSLDPALVMALIASESNFNPGVVSPKNAQGLMQLIPATASRFGVKNAFDALDNLKGGLAYLRWLMAYFKGDVPLVLAAYNAGEQAVERYRGIPPYRETQEYVKHITSVYRKTTHPYSPEVVTSSSLTRAKL